MEENEKKGNIDIKSGESNTNANPAENGQENNPDQSAENGIIPSAESDGQENNTDPAAEEKEESEFQKRFKEAMQGMTVNKVTLLISNEYPDIPNVKIAQLIEKNLNGLIQDEKLLKAVSKLKESTL